MATGVEIEVNGEPRRLEPGTTVEALLRVLDLPASGIAVEVNREVIPRRAHAETVLGDGDRIEIVTFVGGG